MRQETKDALHKADIIIRMATREDFLIEYEDRVALNQICDKLRDIINAQAGACPCQ